MAKKIALLFNYDTSPQYRITFFRQENILRQRSLFFKSFNSNIPMSSVADQKFNSILKRIPVETVFDMLKFLTYEQWFALQFSNWRLAEIIKKNINYLAFPKFHSIGFYVSAKYYLNIYCCLNTI
jgi:hypothetical protein